MEKVGIKNNRGPLSKMLYEHQQVRIFIKEMELSIETETAVMEKFVANAENDIILLRNHITKENTILFPMGDKLLSMETQEKLLNSFEEYEQKVMGKGTHEKLHEMLHEFEKKYLPT